MDYIELKIELNPIEPARGIIIHKLAEQVLRVLLMKTMAC